jgi:hypothetical protein
VAQLISSRNAEVEMKTWKTKEVYERTDGKRRVLIIQRLDGSYSFIEQYWYENVYEGKLVARGWADLPARPTFFQCLETAKQEVTSYFPWLK